MDLDNNKQNGLLIVISGASGTGKGTVIKSLFETMPSLTFSVSATTRKPRLGETDGVNYHFMSRTEFEKEIAADGFLEYADVYGGDYYGTLRREVDQNISVGKDVLLEIDTKGASEVMKKVPNGVFIFLLPPSKAELKKRLLGRGTEDEETVKKRLKAADAELLCAEHYKYVVVNDEVANAVNKIAAIITAEHCTTERNKNILDEVTKE